jgi:hypothetical protein
MFAANSTFISTTGNGTMITSTLEMMTTGSMRSCAVSKFVDFCQGRT